MPAESAGLQLARTSQLPCDLGRGTMWGETRGSKNANSKYLDSWSVLVQTKCDSRPIHWKTSQVAKQECHFLQLAGG
jgi:hypothetical protein